MAYLAGHLLVASRYLRDPNFTRTVVLMIEHSSEGALGVVLNRPSERTVEDVWQAIEAEPCPSQELIYVGGPVPGPLLALHDDPTRAEKKVIDGVYLAVQREHIDALVRRPAGALRLFSGNSGWGSGQLEGEQKAGGWITAPAKSEDVFSDPSTLWPEVTTRIGMKIMLPNGPQGMPSDPRMN